MSTIDPEVKRALDLRLAKGELSIEEYQVLLSKISEGSEKATQDNRASQLLAEVDDLHIYSTHIQVAGRRKEFKEVMAVSGGSTSLTINLMPAIKHTIISVVFSNGDSYYMDEDRAVLGWRRHKKIAECISVMRRLTFEPRMQRLVGELSSEGKIQIGTEAIDPAYTIVGAAIDLVAKKQSAPVSLSEDGSITNGVLTLDLKKCRKDGILELGVQRANVFASGQVYACHDRSLMEKSRNKALKFDIGGKHDDDVVLALLNWLANPANYLVKPSG